MHKLFSILVWILATLFGIIIIGPMGNLIYDQVFKEPAPKTLEYLKNYYEWLLYILFVIVVLTIWSWLDRRNKQNLQKDKQNLQEFYLLKSAQELLPQDLGFYVEDNGQIGSVISRPYHSTYISRKAYFHRISDHIEPENTLTERDLISLLKERKSIIIIGQPLEGKSRTVYEILKNINDYLIVIPFRD